MNITKFLLLSLLVLGVFSERIAQQSNEYVDCKGESNDQPLLHVKPKLVAQTKHAQRYILESGDQYRIHVVNATGTPYEIGYAVGSLMKDEILENEANFAQFIKDNYKIMLKKIHAPKWFIRLITLKGKQILDALLDLNYKISKPYTPQRFLDEMKGMSDGMGGEQYATNIKNLNYFPELIQAACSIVGAWDKATVGEKLYTLRALDWEDGQAPVSKHPLITIYHSTEETEIKSHAFANVGFAGMFGALTAVGSQGVSVQEKVWDPVYVGGRKAVPATYEGKPWAFTLRDLAQFGTTIESMSDMIQNTDRTCSIHVGTASKESRTFQGYDYSWKVLNIYNDKNYTHYNDAHPQMDGVVYFDRYVQPSNHPCTGSVLKQNWGNITPETLYGQVAGYGQTGDAQICVSDVYANTIYLAYSSYPAMVPAYKRQLMFIDLNPFYFGEK